ncbi:MAG: hypothetical protein JZU64_04150, partial [Rhodoferax sp.]|nr:hypothetical protein [Rhodoferax sp.]
MTDTTEHLQVVIPEQFRERFMHAAHHRVGHQGRRRTMALLQEDCYWTGMDRSVRAFLKGCDSCACNRSLAPGPLVAQDSRIDRHNIPNGVVGIDVLGFLPTSEEGFKKLLVMTCHFTRYRVGVPIRTEEATEVVQAVHQHWGMLWGAPLRW